MKFAVVACNVTTTTTAATSSTPPTSNANGRRRFFFNSSAGKSFVFDSRSIRVRGTAPGMGCFSALECTVADVARTCSGTKHHETLDLATAATEERKPSHGSTFGVSQQKPGCEDSGNFQMTSEHFDSPLPQFAAPRAQRKSFGKWRKGRRRRWKHTVCSD